MTDELQVALLATSIAETLSPTPTIHGEYYGALSQLYPLLLAPFFGFLSAPAAITAGHLVNAVLLPSAAVPAFLLARNVSGSRAAGFAAAAMTVFTPWLVMTSTLLTSNVAYPAFVWTVFLCHRALAYPSHRGDLLALAALAVAFFARTQLIVLALTLPVALVLHELLFPLTRRERESRRRRVRHAARRAVALHPVLTAACALGLALAGLLAFAGSLASVVGNYSIPFSGDLLPPGVWDSAAAHLDQVVIGSSVLPFLLAGAWSASALVRPQGRPAHAFACLFVVLVPVFTLQVTSFNLRFTPGAFIQDRYLFYVVPLFAVGAAAMLVQRTHLLLRGILLAATCASFAWLAGFAFYDDETIIFWASPAAAFHPALVTAGDALGMSSIAFVRCTAAVLVVLTLAVLARGRRAAVVMTTVAVSAFGLFQASYVFERFADPALTRESKPAGFPQDWIDRAVPRSASVALVPSPHDSPDYWWEAEYWNKQVDRVLRVSGGPTFSPFPAEEVSLDLETGRLRGSAPSEYLVVSPSETRFRIAKAATVVDATTLRLVRVPRPYRLAWGTRGITADGWKRPSEPALLRFFGHERGGRSRVVLTMSASRNAARPLGFVLRSRGQAIAGSVDPGGARPPVFLDVCVPPGGHTDATLRTSGRARIPDGRVVAVHIDRIEVRPQGPCGGYVSSR